jgi:hypothetical protein
MKNLKSDGTSIVKGSIVTVNIERTIENFIEKKTIYAGTSHYK